MAGSLRALCTDFYVNQKLSVKLDLPDGRETALELFERIRRQHDALSEFKRYREELALETPPGVSPSRWLAIRGNTIRSGVVNPDSLEEAYGLHRDVLEVTPYFLSISPLDIDFVEVLYGFDLAAGGNHDAIVYQALLEGTPMGALLDDGGPDGPVGRPIDCQPVFGLLLDEDDSEDVGAGRLEAHFEVKTRSGGVERARGAGDPDAGGLEPISVYLTVRQHGPMKDVKAMPGVLDRLVAWGERLVETRVAPHLLEPIRGVIVAGGGTGGGGTGGL